jgi:hypothetical protein
MSLRDEVQELVSARISDDPVWQKLAQGSAQGGEVRIAGELDETLSMLMDALVKSTDATLGALLLITEKVDELESRVALGM